MATAKVVTIDPHHLPVSGVPKLSSDSAAELSKLMQENHEKHHVFFNQAGFHNHIGHHLVTLYALGATPEQIQYAYSHNAQYQRGPVPEHVELQSKFKDPEVFIKALGDETEYHDYLSFFDAEIASLGIQKVLDEYVFKGDERSRQMYNRLFASLLHPIIHLGLAIEFDIPAMVAEGLAWTAVHKNEIGSLHDDIAELVKSSAAPSPPVNLLSIFKKLDNDEMRSGVTPDTFMKGGRLYTSKSDEVKALAATYRVTEDTLAERTNELINVVSYVTMAMQRPPYTPKIDFFGVHMLNSSVFLPAINKALPPAQAVRVVEGLARAYIFTYAGLGAVGLHLDWTLSFARDPARRARQYSGTVYPDWQSLYDRANVLDDDGHVSKAIRALKGGEQVAGVQTRFEEPLKKEDFLDLAAVLMRSCEEEKDFVGAGFAATNQWVRLSAFEFGWKPFAKIE